MDYKAPDNIYWLFSSAAQAIAAFNGLLTAAFFFGQERLSKLVENDETLESIIEKLKTSHFRFIKSILLLTGLSVVLDLFVVYTNAFDWGSIKRFLQIITIVINLVTLFLAIYYAITAINPRKIINTANTLIRENTPAFTNSSGQFLSRAHFLEQFIQLERLIRVLYEKKQNVLPSGSNEHPSFKALGRILNDLRQLEVLNPLEFEQLQYVTRIRNLTVHGQVEQIDPTLGESVIELISLIENKIANS